MIVENTLKFFRIHWNSIRFHRIPRGGVKIKRERLSVGTVPTVKMHPVGTVPTVKMHPVGTVPTDKMHPVGTVPTDKIHPVGTFPTDKMHPVGTIILSSSTFWA